MPRKIESQQQQAPKPNGGPSTSAAHGTPAQAMPTTTTATTASHISDNMSLGAVTRLIPPLEGEPNLQHWKAMIIKALDLLQLRKYIDTSIPCPQSTTDQEKWRTERAIAALILESSLSRVRDRLTDAGLPLDEPDPAAMFRQVCATFDKYGNYDGARLYKRLTTTRRADHESSRLYLAEVRRLRSRMIEIGACDDAFILEQALGNLQGFVGGDVLGRLGRKVERGDWGFEEVVEAVGEWERGGNGGAAGGGKVLGVLGAPTPPASVPVVANSRRGSVAAEPMRNSWASSQVGTQVRRD